MKRSPSRRFLALVVVALINVMPVNQGQWVCVLDGVPCPAQSHTGARGMVDRCCCDDFQASNAIDCCGHEQSPTRPQSGAKTPCGVPDIYVVAERDVARVAKTHASINHHQATMLSSPSWTWQRADNGGLAPRNEVSSSQTLASRLYASRAPPLL